MSVSDSMDEMGSDRGPINALSKALAKDLGPYQAVIDDIEARLASLELYR